MTKQRKSRLLRQPHFQIGKDLAVLKFTHTTGYYMGQNKVYMIEGDIIVIEGIGHQTYEAVKYVEIESAKLIVKLRAEQKPVRIFIELGEVASHEIGGRKAGFELLKALDYDKIVMTGANMMLKYVVILIIKASGKEDKIKVMDDRGKAMEWIRL